MTPIRPEDDSFHDPTPDPYWNESAWFGFMAPERSLQGGVYMYHRPNMRHTIGGVLLWDPSGREIRDCLFYDWGTPHALPDGADMFDFELPNGLRVECREPLRSFHLRYGVEDASWYLSQGCKLDLEYEGFIEPHASMMPQGQEEWGGDPSIPAVDGKLVNGHYRQPGRMRGVIELNGETIEIDGFSMRDHSWGPRRLKNNPRGSWCWAIASEESFFQVMGSAAQSPENDPVVGAVDPVLCGSYLKDGLLGDVHDGKISIVDRDSDGGPRQIVAECIDSHGREFQATGVSRNMLNWTGYPFMMMWWPQVEWTFDGQTAYGECQDWWPLQHARSYLRSLSRR